MFTTSPEVLALFSKFQNLATEEEMRASETFQEHGEKVLIIILMMMMMMMMMMMITITITIAMVMAMAWTMIMIIVMMMTVFTSSA